MLTAVCRANTSSKLTTSKVVEVTPDTNLISTLSLPLTFFNIPRVKLPIPSLQTITPSAFTVFCILFASYFLVLSGVIYDLVTETPSIGMVRDEVTGAQKPQAFLPYRINGQYIIEGMTAGFLFALGGLGFILLDRSTSPTSHQRNRYLFALSGVLLVLLSFSLCRVFIRIKVPGY